MLRPVGGLRNQPEWLANLIVTYNQGQVGLNVAWRLRGRTFTGTFGATPAQDIWIDRYRRLDAQATIKVLPTLTLFAEARNLTRSYWVEQTGLSASATTTVTTQGRWFWMGATFKM